MIKAVIFDCFGVLTTDTWRAFCDSLPPGADVARARELNHRYDEGLVSREEFLDGVFQLTGQRPRQVEKLLDSEITKNRLLLDYIRELKPRYKIGLLSNVATPWITDTFLTAEEQKLFDDMVFSFEVSMTKPDPRIFQVAADRLGVTPADCLFIDDIASYAAAARKVGMPAVVYQNYPQTRAEIEKILAK